VGRGEKDKGGEDEDENIGGTAAENPTTLTTVSTAPTPVDDFMHTIEFKRLFAPFVHEQTLMSLRVFNKEWNCMVDISSTRA